MPKQQFNARLEAPVIASIKRISSDYGLTEAQVIRAAVNLLDAYIVAPPPVAMLLLQRLQAPPGETPVSPEPE